MCGAIVLFGGLTIWGADSNGIPNWVVLPGIVWGNPSIRGIRTGIWITGKADSTIATVWAVSPTNITWTYFRPPGIKFYRVELRDLAGTLIPPLRPKKLYGDLPQKILPPEPSSGERGRALLETPRSTERASIRDRLFGPLGTLGSFTVQDEYPIEKEGDYKLTIGAIIYSFIPDFRRVQIPPLKQDILRFDLPCVTRTIHVKPKGK